ncbi:hypothetical protein IFM89_018305, partial [Coptis chinensis]
MPAKKTVALVSRNGSGKSSIIPPMERFYDPTLALILNAFWPAFRRSPVGCSLEKGYETKVGRAGLALTEEQKSKLSVARAVLSNPSILLLDEVTGGLDFEAEGAIQEALDILMLGRSTIIIAQRLRLIRNANYIAMMEEGQLVEMGTHEELLTIDGLFAELLRCDEAAKLPKRGDRYANVGDFSLGFDNEDPPRHLLRVC